MIDGSEALEMALEDFGEMVIIAGVERLALYNPGSASPGPYLDDPGLTPPSVTLLRRDLEAIGQWPLTADELTYAGPTYAVQTWRTVRPAREVAGGVTILLRENA